MTNRQRWTLYICLFILCFALIVYFGYNYYTNRNRVNVYLSPTNTSLADDETSGWLELNNIPNKYTIKYPPGADVSNATETVSEKTKPIEQASCVKIATSYVSIVVSADANEDNSIYCLSTGYGTDWREAPNDTVIINGTTYNNKGMKTEAASAGYYKAEYIVKLDDNRNTVLYSINVNEKYNNEITRAQALNIAHQILATYRPQ